MGARQKVLTYQVTDGSNIKQFSMREQHDFVNDQLILAHQSTLLYKLSWVGASLKINRREIGIRISLVENFPKFNWWENVN